MEITLDILQKVIKKREPNSHKGNFGRVLLIGGNINYGGAIIMAASAAVHAGAGLVTVATNKENLSSLHSVVPEAMFINFFDKVSLTTAISTADAVVVGPGLGTDNRAREVLEVTLSNISDNQLCIIDGSAITLISENDSLKELIANNKKIIFTPLNLGWVMQPYGGRGGGASAWGRGFCLLSSVTYFLYILTFYYPSSG